MQFFSDRLFMSTSVLLIIITDLPSDISRCSFYIFADDLQLYCSFVYSKANANQAVTIKIRDLARAIVFGNEPGG